MFWTYNQSKEIELKESNWGKVLNQINIEIETTIFEVFQILFPFKSINIECKTNFNIKENI